jgi:SAM-dependent methyltransferase
MLRGQRASRAAASSDRLAASDDVRSTPQVQSPGPGSQGRTGLFWPLYARVYDAIWDSPLTRHVALAALAAAPRGGDVVDLGCGTGLVAREFVARGDRVVGVDASGAMLRKARREGRVSVGVLSCADSTPLASASAGTVLACNLLHLQRDPEFCLAEVVRLAAPGAAIILTWPLDGVTHERVLAADIASGRGWSSAVRADILRRAVALPFTLLRAPRTDAARLMAAVESLSHSRLVVVDSRLSVLDCQQIVVLRRSEMADNSGRPGDRLAAIEVNSGRRLGAVGEEVAVRLHRRTTASVRRLCAAPTVPTACSMTHLDPLAIREILETDTRAESLPTAARVGAHSVNALPEDRSRRSRDRARFRSIRGLFKAPDLSAASPSLRHVRVAARERRSNGGFSPVSRRRASSFSLLTMSALLAMALSGCSSGPGGETTCAKFASMDSRTGLLSSPNSEQTSVIKKMLDDHGKDTGAMNVSLAYMQIVAYCNIYDGVSSSNSTQSIDGIPGMK